MTIAQRVSIDGQGEQKPSFNPGEWEMLARGEPHLSRAMIEVLVTSWVVSQREVHGTDWCRYNFVGPWRRAMGTTLPPNAIGLSCTIEGGAIAANMVRD